MPNAVAMGCGPRYIDVGLQPHPSDHARCLPNVIHRWLHVPAVNGCGAAALSLLRSLHLDCWPLARPPVVLVLPVVRRLNR